MFADRPLLSRIMAILLLLTVTVAIGIGVVDPLLQVNRDNKADIARLEQLIGAYEARRANAVTMRDALTSLKNDTSTRRSFVEAKNLTLAATKLQSRIKTLADAAGAQLQSTQVIEPQISGAEFPTIRVRTQLVTRIRSLRDIFHALEAVQPTVFIDGVTIAASLTGRASDSKAGMLDISFDSYAYVWNEESAL